MGNIIKNILYFIHLQIEYISFVVINQNLLLFKIFFNGVSDLFGWLSIMGFCFKQKNALFNLQFQSDENLLTLVLTGLG